MVKKQSRQHLRRKLLVTSMISLFSACALVQMPGQLLQAQTYLLQPGDEPLRQQVDVSVDVQGVVKIKSARFGVVDQRVKVHGKQNYEQRLFFQRATQLCRAIRYYQNLESNVSIGEGELSHQLRKERRLVVDQYQNQQHRLYSPQGMLTRDELDLLDVQLSPTVFYKLLPPGPVMQGDQWQLDEADLSALLTLDAVAQSDISATLQSVTANEAQIVCKGSVGGGVNGVLTQIDLELSAQYNLITHSFTLVSLEMSERREIGYAKPGLDVEARIVVALQPTDSFKTLTDSIIEKCDRPIIASDEMLEFIPQVNSIQLKLNRDWHVMMDQPELLVMRQVVRGELVAQCSLSRLQPLRDGQRMSVELLKDQIQKSQGDKLAKITDSRQERLHGKYPLTHIAAVGLVGEATYQWAYHHITDLSGNQYVFVFTIPSDKVTQFQLQDRNIIESFVFRAEQAEKQPIPASAATSTTKR